MIISSTHNNTILIISITISIMTVTFNEQSHIINADQVRH